MSTYGKCVIITHANTNNIEIVVNKGHLCTKNIKQTNYGWFMTNVYCLEDFNNIGNNSQANSCSFLTTQCEIVKLNFKKQMYRWTSGGNEILALFTQHTWWISNQCFHLRQTVFSYVPDFNDAVHIAGDEPTVAFVGCHHYTADCVDKQSDNRYKKANTLSSRCISWTSSIISLQLLLFKKLS